jgi:hypothetical protein
LWCPDDRRAASGIVEQVIARGRMRFPRLPRVTFEAVSFPLLLILWIPLCLILIWNELVAELDLAFLAPIGGFGPGKEKIFASVAACFLICSVALYVADLRRKRLWIRSLLLASLAVTYLGSVGMASAVRRYSSHLQGADAGFDDFGRIRFEEYPNLDYERVFSKKALKQLELKTFVDLSEFAERRFSRFRPELESAWGTGSESYLKVFFYLNFVSSLWSYGNPMSPRETGCVLINENTNFKPVPEEGITVRTYIESDIGCCTDYAYMLHFLLDRAHLEARLVELPGHVLNEVKVDGKWMALDANVNVFYRQSWKETVGRGGKEIGVVMFPLLAVNPTHKHGYRPLAGSFRQFMLARVAMGFHAPLSYSQTLPEYFR